MSPRGRILVTGAAGFIGSHLCDLLVGRGDSVVGVDNLSMGSRDNLADLAGSDRFRLVVADVRDAGAMREAMRGCASVVHLAAMKIPRYGDSLQTLLVNSFGAENVLETAREAGARVVIASTSDVYARSDRLPYREDDVLVLGPSTVRRWSYAVSKLYNEHLAFAYEEAHRLPVVVLRFFGAYGPRQHRSWWGGPQALFIERMLRGQPIEIHGDGLQTRTFTFVGDTVRGIAAALDREEATGEIFNVGSDHEISVLDLAHRVYAALGGSGAPAIEWVPYSRFSRGYEDVRRRVPDTTKARERLGFEAKTPLDEGLARTIAWQRPLVEAETGGAGR